MVYCCEKCGAIVKKGQYKNVKGKITHIDNCSSYYNQKKISKIKSKEEARDEAIEWQNWASNQNLSYGELAQYQNYFTKLARKFGLLREFKENGII